MKISCSIVALIKSKFTKEINKTTVGTDDLNLLGWVVLKLDEMSQWLIILNEPLEKLCATNDTEYWKGWLRLIWIEECLYFKFYWWSF